MENPGGRFPLFGILDICKVTIINKEGIERIFMQWIAYLPLMNAQSTVLINWRDAFLSAVGVAPSYVFERKNDPVSVGPAGPRIFTQWMPYKVRAVFPVSAT